MFVKKAESNSVILGLHFLGHDVSACILVNGKLISGSEEERFNRIKHGGNEFPAKSILAAVERAGISISDIKHVAAIYQHPLITLLKLLKSYVITLPKQRAELRYVIRSLKSSLYKLFSASLIRDREIKRLKLELRKLGLDNFSVDFYEHHLCHAASAFFYSGFSESLVVTADGKGHATSISIYRASSTKGLKKIKSFDPRFSFGFPYTAVTKFLGFEPNDGEYKLMGLAPYGNPKYLNECSSLIKVSRYGDIDRIGANFYIGFEDSMLRMSELFRVKPRAKGQDFSQEHKDVAASIQLSLENSFLKLIRGLSESHNFENFCFAGGVALNVKLNQKIRESNLFREIFFQPLSGDNGLALGAAALKHFELKNQMPEPMCSLGLGPRFTDSEAEQAIEDYGMLFYMPTNLPKEVAKLISTGAVVGWFQGGMEFGPRAMGYRSILADATSFENKSKVNLKIKFRESFRPFCPSILAEDLGDLGIYSANVLPYFMIESFRLSDEVRERFPAVVHIDNSTRPQAVTTDNSDPYYYKLLLEMKKLIGIGIVLNTSLNRNGEPIVCSPSEALEVFCNTDMDYLVINKLIVKKS